MVRNMAKKTKSTKSKKSVKKITKTVKKPMALQKETLPHCTRCTAVELTLLKYSDEGPEFECKQCKNKYCGRPN